jgi:hypothetical protein
MVTRLLIRLLAMLICAAPAVAVAGLPNCDHNDLVRRMSAHFNDAQETRNSPRRARKLENVVETGVGPAEGLFTPKEYRTRYCEGDLRLDDNSTLHVYIIAVGIPDDKKASAEAIETCWSDPRFPRYSEGCDTEIAPARRK